MINNIRIFISELAVRIRKLFSRKGKPTKSDFDDFTITMALKDAINLQKELGLDERNYFGVAGFSHADARAYYIYGILDEVIKVATSMIRWRELLSGEDKPCVDEEDQHIRRVIIESVIDEQMMWQRKLVEALCNLICFVNTNEQELYRALLLATDIDAFVGKQADFKEFYSCESNNIKESLKHSWKRLKQIADKTDRNKLWFLRDDVLRRTPDNFRSGQIIESFRRRYKIALVSSDEPLKLVLGVSYESGYSVSSKSIHISVGAPRIQKDVEEVRVNMSHISLLLPHILIKGHELCGIKEKGVLEKVKKCFRESNAPDLIKNIYQRDHEIGDLVLAYGDFAEITDCKKSKYGYCAYKIKYLSRPPIEHITEDWFPAEYVTRVARKRMAKEFFRRNLPRNDIGKKVLEMIDKMPDDRIYDSMRNILKTFADAGVLMKMLQEGAARRESSPGKNSE